MLRTLKYVLDITADGRNLYAERLKHTHKTTANCISKANTVLHHFGKADFHGKKRVAIVGQESGALQWPKGYTTTGTGRYSERYIQNGWGSVRRGIRTGGQ